MGLNIIRTDSVSALVAKQPLLTGQPGQVVGFDGMGLAYAVRGWSNQNLLDNWYFPNPINQRGVSGTITAPGYFIDRWKLVSGSVTITEGGLLLNGTMVQILEDDPGQEVTASYLTDGGVFQAEYDSGTRTFAITVEGVLIHAAKLESGAQQTIACQDVEGNWVLNDPPPNKALELAKCQRYYRKSGVITFTANDVVYEYISVGIEFPTAMRATPTITIRSQISKEIGEVTNFLSGQTVEGLSVEANTINENGFAGLHITNGSLPQDVIATFIYEADANM